MNELKTNYQDNGCEITIVTERSDGNASATKILLKGNQFGLTEITKTNEGIALVIYGEWERHDLFNAFNEHFEKLNNV